MGVEVDGLLGLSAHFEFEQKFFVRRALIELVEKDVFVFQFLVNEFANRVEPSVFGENQWIVDLDVESFDKAGIDLQAIVRAVDKVLFKKITNIYFNYKLNVMILLLLCK